MQPSPNRRREGIRIVTFEACSGFTHVTAHRIAQPPKVTFVTRLQPSPLPSRTARQLPDLSTSIRVRSSLTDGSRPRGALPYRATGEALADFLAGVVQIHADPVTLPHVAAGKARLLAVLDRVRRPDFPDVPLLKEIYPALDF